MNDFVKCVTMKKTKDGYIIECKVGLWSVLAPTRNKAETEARHYFEQYKADGEYHKLIGGPSPIEVLRGDV